MTLNHEPKYPSRRSYVLKFSGDATSTAMTGRLENLVTGKQREFHSVDQLIEIIREDIEWK